MTSESVTGSFVIDFGELANQIYQTVLRYEEKGDRHLQMDASDLVYDLIDDFITHQLIWTRPMVLRSSVVRSGRRPRREDYYAQEPYKGVNVYKKYKHLLRNLPDRVGLIESVSDRMADLIYRHIELPTWRIVHLTRHRNNVLIEVGEDYRVEQWMKEHGQEYGFRVD